MAKEISENIEEYLEVLYKFGSKDSYVSTTTLSRELGIAPGSVTQMLKKLEDLGYIKYTPYKGAVLTHEGMKIAQKITRKHRILEKFLIDVLKIKEENVHDQACEMEHTLSDEAERALCAMLNNPDVCPDNNVIPACNFDFDSCHQCYSQKDFDQIINRQFNLLSISQLASGEEGEVLFIRGGDASLSDAMDAGIAIGSKIRISDSESSDYNVFIDDSQIEVSRDLANNIFVKTF